MRQTSLMTLGQVYDKRGRSAEAEKPYREAYLISPQTGAAPGLGVALVGQDSVQPWFEGVGVAQ